MYEFYYDKFQPYWHQENLKLLYADTDSMILSIKTQDIEKDLEYFKDDFDFSNLKHRLYDPIHEKVIGKMKIETDKAIYLDEFIALRSKSYSYSYSYDEKIDYQIKQKGVKQKPKFDEFKKVLFESKELETINRSIRSKNHNLYVVEQTKKSANAFDDKRYYINSIESLPFRN